jgi:hypothetical protein
MGVQAWDRLGLNCRPKGDAGMYRKYHYEWPKTGHIKDMT